MWPKPSCTTVVGSAQPELRPTGQARGRAGSTLRPAVQQFSHLSDAGPGGFTLDGSGTAAVTTPGVYQPGSAASVTVVVPAGTTTTQTNVDSTGRLTISVPLSAPLFGVTAPTGTARVTSCSVNRSPRITNEPARYFILSSFRTRCFVEHHLFPAFFPARLRGLLRQSLGERDSLALAAALPHGRAAPRGRRGQPRSVPLSSPGSSRGSFITIPQKRNWLAGAGSAHISYHVAVVLPAAVQQQ